MVKPPKDSEVIMYGEKSAPPQRAEIISVGKDGAHRVEKGGVMRAPLAAAAQKPAPAPVPAPKPEAPRPAAPVVKPIPSPVAAKPVPKPKPVTPTNVKDVSRALAANTVGTLVDQMRTAAAANGGMLTLDDIDKMQTQMAQSAKDIERQMEQAFEQYADAQERQRWASARRDVFFRLLVKQFAHLFKEPASRKTVSRRMLPGFFMATAMLLGPDAVEKYQERCRNIVARLKDDTDGEHFDWDAFYNERDALTVSLDAQVIIAAGFVDFDKRANWFLTLVNSHLSPAGGNDSEAEQRWELAEPGLRRMLDALFGNLRKVLSSEKGRERLLKRHGKDVVGNALQALKRVLTG